MELGTIVLEVDSKIMDPSKGEMVGKAATAGSGIFARKLIGSIFDVLDGITCCSLHIFFERSLQSTLVCDGWCKGRQVLTPENDLKSCFILLLFILELNGSNH